MKKSSEMSLKDQADKHTEHAVVANRAGDDEKVRYHQAQVAKIKNKLLKLNTVTSENKAEHDKKFMNARAGKKEEPKLSIDDMKNKYKENESNNYHTENALMLAQNFGTKREQNAVSKALEYRNKAGGYKSDDPMANLHYKTTHEIHSKYWPHLHDEEE